MDLFLLQLFIFLAAAVIAVPLSKKLGLGSVLGYLIAGIVIGPFGLSLISDIDAVMHFTEFGVVMMLFLVGLELKPSLLWKMKTPILGMGGLQVVLSSIAIGFIAYFFLPWQQAIAIGLILSLSSTAIVLQTLQEKGLMNSPSGRSIFSVLLFQDLAVIPILALLPLLATFPTHADDHHGVAFFDIHTLPNYVQVLVTISAILIVFFVGKFASRPMFRTIAATRLREIFVASALSLVVGISLLMNAVGLSPALGTFLAGVVLADSEYRHELESDIAPFKGLLLGIFFISIGASLNFTLISNNILLILGLTFGLLTLKWIILLILSFVFKMQNKERSLFSIALAQGGEFAFVLFQFSKTNGILNAKSIDPMISAVALSMFLTPLIFLIHEKLAKRCNTEQEINREADKIESSGKKVILAGFGRLGLDLGRFLISSGIKPIIIDNDASNIDILRRYGFKVYYGDITRLDLLEAAGAADAELIMITISNLEKSKQLVELLKKHFPKLKIAMSVADRASSYEIMDLGVSNVRRETFGSALELGQDALELLGFEPYEAYRKVRVFRKKDNEMTPELYKIHREDEEKYISMYQNHLVEIEELIKFDMSNNTDEVDKAWAVIDPDK
jgi:CPA2 family monovalent cation:H+ antiporter-2/glutathione-regulated potassium-efflux system ancillary protein KefC